MVRVDSGPRTSAGPSRCPWLRLIDFERSPDSPGCHSGRVGFVGFVFMRLASQSGCHSGRIGFVCLFFSGESKPEASRHGPYNLSILPLGSFGGFCEGKLRPSQTEQSANISQIVTGFVLSLCCAGRGLTCAYVGRPRRTVLVCLDRIHRRDRLSGSCGVDYDCCSALAWSVSSSAREVCVTNDSIRVRLQGRHSSPATPSLK